MIKIPYDELGKMNFQQAVQKLANSQCREPIVFRVKAVTKGLREGFFAMREDYQNNIEKLYALKEDGKITEAKEGSKAAEFKLPFHAADEVAADAKSAVDAFGKKIFTLEQKKIPYETILKMSDWSARELEALEPIVEEPGDQA
jgi:hypothetical protein